MPDAKNILEATLSQLPELVPLFDAYRVFYKKQSNLKETESFLRERIVNKESVLFISHHINGNATGFVQLYPIFSSTQLKRFWLLNDLYVDEKYRGQGFGYALIEKAKELCMQSKSAGMMLETEKTNTAGNKLYLKTGFNLDDNHNYFFWEA